MKSIFQKPKVTPPNGRNGFDESRRILYSCSPGQLLPTYDCFCTAGDVFKITADTKVRTEAVKTAAFTRFILHNDYFFVPMRQLYQFWNEFYNQTFDAHTNFVESVDRFELPLFKIDSFLYFGSSFPSYFGTYDSTNKLATLTIDNFGIPKLWNFRRLFSMLGYGNVDSYSSATPLFKDNALLKYLCYHRIFYSHYNNSDWFVDLPYMYNVDKNFGSVISPSIDSASLKVCGDIVSTLHYRPWRTNFFNNLYPTPTFSSAFGNFLSESFLDSDNLRSKVNPEYVGDNGLGQTNAIGAYLSNSSSIPLNEINAADLRSVFALDKLLRVTALAGSHYDEQTYAHLGVKIPDGLAKEAYFLGSDSTDVNVSEVVANATTNTFDSSSDEIIPGSVIGDIAGKAFGTNNGKTISFKCPEDGIIMCITSIEPMIDYSSQSLDVVNFYKHSFDFFHPEFDNLGMQPFDNNWLVGHISDSPHVVGWSPRYSELKTKYDVVHESIYASDKADWQTNFKSSVTDSGLKTFDKWPRFYIFPQYANSIFAAQVPHYSSSGNNSPHYNASSAVSAGFSAPFNSENNVYASDNFIVCINFNAFKTSIMSVHSIPKIS